MKNIYQASFEESENFVTDKYIDTAIDKSSGKNIFKRLVGVTTACLILYLTYFLFQFVESEAPYNIQILPLKFGMGWIYISLFVYILYLIRMISNRNVKAVLAFVFDSTMFVYLMIYIAFVFLFTLSVVDYVTGTTLLDIPYLFLFLLFIYLSNTTVNKGILVSLYNEQVYEDKFLKLFEKFRKKAMRYGGIIILGIAAFNGIFGQNSNGEMTIVNRFVGTLFPFLAFVGMLGSLYMKSTVIQGYYVKKYTEQYRMKYGYTKVEWYGKKYKS